MKSRIFYLTLLILALLVFSCDDELSGLLNTNYETRTFYARDFRNVNHYQLEAELMIEGTYCNVWVERGSGVNVSAARRLANAYDYTIYPRMMEAFVIRRNFTDGVDIIARDTMELADWMGDGDGKLAILVLNIRDGHQPGVNDTLVAGYFWPGNLYSNDPRDLYLRFSNESDMIYINGNRLAPTLGSPESNATLAHELQHLMNFVTSFVFRESPMDTWIDEGLSMSAEWVVTGAQIGNYASWYNHDPSGLIQKGNNFFIWDNHRSNNLAIIDDYATAYLFFQWLRLQAGSSGIYFNIMASNYSDYMAVTTVMNRILPGRRYDDWGTLLRTWFAANYVNAPSGQFGYMDDGVLRNIKASTMPGGTTSINLAPGEGVYSVTNSNFSMPRNGGNIRYAGLSTGSPWLSDSAVFSGGALLSYNINTDTWGRAESGSISGISSSVDSTPDEISRQAPVFPGPFAISAGDMLRRHGHQEEGSFISTRARIGIIGDE